MDWRWPRPLGAAVVLGLAAGCSQADRRPVIDQAIRPTAYHSAERPKPRAEPEAVRVPSDPATPADLAGPQPVDAFIRRALVENQTVQAARYNVLAMQSRIPQVTSLDDPTVSNTIYPIPGAAPQYSLMGYNPYNLMIAQQFPWFGTLRLRGEAAAKDAEVALAELAAAQLDAVAAVKRAYYDLYFNARAEAILGENRKLAVDFIAIARERYRTGGTGQQDVLRAEVVVDDLDRELIRVRQGATSARADLAQQVHADPEADLQTLPELPTAGVPAEVDRLYRLALASRPELKGRLSAIARDNRAVELARKRYKPDVTLGFSYMDMEKTNAEMPRTASGVPNLGMFVGFNLPVYRKKLAAGVCEAQARASADAHLYGAERDAAYREIKDLMAQARSQRDILALFQSSILPKSTQALEAATGDYQAGTVDYVTLLSAWREVLQIQLQAAQVESELGKIMASLERAVGCQLNENPIAPPPPVPAPAPAPSPPPASAPGPFRPGDR
ncbi:TolC family protein [Tundrisphaera sp. TA3]|uniref:TolC family protein n=1 Tax=Tundrisphaera sp. TA3 TaxID=3435775 RepID=UPI003EBD79E3